MNKVIVCDEKIIGVTDNNSNVVFTLNTLQQLSKQSRSDDEVFPRRLCMVSFNICDYTGKNTNGKVVILPYDDMMGIVCSDEKIKVAKKTIYDYCIKNNIFPVNENVLKHFDVKFVKVKRSNGDIENDWIIADRSQTAKINDKLCVQVIKDVITKYVSLEELCMMNNLNYETFSKLLINELEYMYLTDCELFGENMFSVIK